MVDEMTPAKRTPASIDRDRRMDPSKPRFANSGFFEARNSASDITTLLCDPQDSRHRRARRAMHERGHRPGDRHRAAASSSAPPSQCLDAGSSRSGSLASSVQEIRATTQPQCGENSLEFTGRVRRSAARRSWTRAGHGRHRQGGIDRPERRAAGDRHRLPVELFLNGRSNARRAGLFYRSLTACWPALGLGFLPVLSWMRHWFP